MPKNAKKLFVWTVLTLSLLLEDAVSLDILFFLMPVFPKVCDFATSFLPPFSKNWSKIFPNYNWPALITYDCGWRRKWLRRSWLILPKFSLISVWWDRSFWLKLLFSLIWLMLYLWICGDFGPKSIWKGASREVLLNSRRKFHPGYL